jgi:hypothetical protein
MPDLNVSNDTIEFGIVKCGECKIATIQLKNPQEIRCEWIAAYPGVSFRRMKFFFLEFYLLNI